QPDLCQLAKGARHLRQDRAAGGGHHDVLRQLPAELLGDLEPIRLGAFGIVRAQVDVDEGPAVLVGDLAAQPVDVVVVAADRHRARSVDGGADDLALLEVVGDEDEAVEPGARRVCRDAVGEVAGRGARDGAEVELDRLGDGYRYYPILVREGRVIHRV